MLRKCLILICIITISVFSLDLLAQCPMCKVAAESNLAAGGTEGKGLNKGILYMLSLPYLLVGGLAYMWWRHNRDEMNDERDRRQAISNLLSDAESNQR